MTDKAEGLPPFEPFFQRYWYLSKKVFRSSALMSAVRPGSSRWRNYFGFISSANMCKEQASLHLLLFLIALRQYTEKNFLLMVPRERASDHMKKPYNIIAVITLVIILVFNAFPVFDIHPRQHSMNHKCLPIGNSKMIFKIQLLPKGLLQFYLC